MHGTWQNSHMESAPYYERVMAGEGGPLGLPLRGAMWCASKLYEIGVDFRNRRFDGDAAIETVPVPVISVGNITTGGTGKTPFVIEVVRRLFARGCNPAVVARGYRARPNQPNDEERLIRQRCPEVSYVADGDRVAAARRACQRHGADCLVLDDGFQHRGLARDLDIVLIDATCPFGYGHVLPRGMLREPLESLRRADALVVTRCDQVAPAQIERILPTLRSLNPDAYILRCQHRVTEVVSLNGSKASGADSQRPAYLFAAIGNPRSFLTTVRSLGIDVAGQRWWPDHHQYTARDVELLARRRERCGPARLLTTEKDAVKLIDVAAAASADIGVVRISIDFVDEGDTMLDNLLDRVLSE